MQFISLVESQTTSSNQSARLQNGDATSRAAARCPLSDTRTPSPTPRRLSSPSESAARSSSRPGPQTETAPWSALPGPQEIYPEQAPTTPTPSPAQNSESCLRRYFRQENVPSTPHPPADRQLPRVSTQCLILRL